MRAYENSQFQFQITFELFGPREILKIFGETLPVAEPTQKLGFFIIHLSSPAIILLSTINRKGEFKKTK